MRKGLLRINCSVGRQIISHVLSQDIGKVVSDISGPRKGQTRTHTHLGASLLMCINCHLRYFAINRASARQPRNITSPHLRRQTFIQILIITTNGSLLLSTSQKRSTCKIEVLYIWYSQGTGNSTLSREPGTAEPICPSFNNQKKYGILQSTSWGYVVQ